MDIYVAKRTFVLTLDGRRVIVRQGQTVREGHPIFAAASAGQLVPLSVDYEYEAPKRKAAPKVEQATAAPGEVREVAPAPEVD